MGHVIGKRILNFGLTGQSVLLLLSLSTFAFTRLYSKITEKLVFLFDNN